MKIETMKWLIFGLILIFIVMVALPAFAGEKECNRKHEQCGHNNGGNDDGGATTTIESAGGEGGAGGIAGSDANSEAYSQAEADASAEASSSSEGGSVGDINIDTGSEIPADTTHKLDARIENTPDIVTITPGSGDSCKAHIGFGASVPGVGASMNIPLPGKECRKLKAYDRAVVMEQWQAAEIMFCALKEVGAEFRSVDLNCVDILTLYVEPVPEPEPTGLVAITEGEYEMLLMAQQQTEEFEEQQQLVIDRFAKYDNLISDREAQRELDDAEIERLRREVAKAKAQADEDAARRAKARAIKEEGVK